jgi:hypothetical protein
MFVSDGAGRVGAWNRPLYFLRAGQMLPHGRTIRKVQNKTIAKWYGTTRVTDTPEVGSVITLACGSIVDAHHNCSAYLAFEWCHPSSFEGFEKALNQSKHDFSDQSPYHVTLRHGWARIPRFSKSRPRGLRTAMDMPTDCDNASMFYVLLDPHRPESL